MKRTTRRARRLAAAAAGLTAACTLAFPAATAHAAAGSYTPNSHEWWFNSWDLQQKVWPTTQGSGVTVAVIDSGVQASNPDLQGVLEPGADMLGYGGNGGQDYESNGGHGTAMAALIAGQGIGLGPVGVAPQAKILPVHAIDPSSGMTPVANGIKYAVDHGASVINLSVGANSPTATSCDPQVQDAVAYALAHNVVVVASSGDINRGGPAPQEPATCAGVLAVGGVEQNGSPWQYSTQGPNVVVAAPGDHIYIVSSDGRSYSITASGTSSSSALVSGAAALVRAANPSMPWYTVDQRLIGTAIPDGPVPNDATGYGIINVNKAVNASQYPVSSSAPNPVYARYQSWLQTPAGQQFAQANGISTSNPSQATLTPAKSSSSTTLIIILAVVILILLIAAGVIIGLVTRKRK